MSTEPVHVRIYRIMGEANGVQARGGFLNEAEQDAVVRWSAFKRNCGEPLAALIQAKETRDIGLADKAVAEVVRLLEQVGAP